MKPTVEVKRIGSVFGHYRTATALKSAIDDGLKFVVDGSYIYMVKGDKKECLCPISDNIGIEQDCLIERYSTNEYIWADFLFNKPFDDVKLGEDGHYYPNESSFSKIVQVTGATQAYMYMITKICRVIIDSLPIDETFEITIAID